MSRLSLAISSARSSAATYDPRSASRHRCADTVPITAFDERPADAASRCVIAGSRRARWNCSPSSLTYMHKTYRAAYWGILGCP